MSSDLAPCDDFTLSFEIPNSLIDFLINELLKTNVLLTYCEKLINNGAKSNS